MNRPQWFRGLATDPGAQRKAPRRVIQRENKPKGPRLDKQFDGPATTPVAVAGKRHQKISLLHLVTGAAGKQPGVKAMNEIISGAWKGHLGRGLAHKELQYLLASAQGMTAKQIARQFDVAACTVAKRLSCAMFKLGVTRQTAAVAEAMRRQIISPMCFILASLIAVHAMLGDDAMRRDRRIPERRTAQVRIVRHSEQPSLIA